MVFIENQSTPTFQHESYESALTEGKRLSKKTGMKAFILKAVSSVELNEFLIQPLENSPFDDEDLPF
jgi:hypothetical protein